MDNSIRSYDLFASMDVDKKHIVLAILNHDGLVRKIMLRYDGVNLLNYVRKHFADQKVLFIYEAGPTGYGLYDFLKEQNEECRVAVPSMIPTAPGQRVKTNRLDAYNLGVQARGGDLRYVQVPEKRYRDLGHLTRLRVRYSKGLVATKNRLKAIYLFEGLPFPEGKWSRATVKRVSEIQYRPAVQLKVRELLKDLEFYRTQELLTKAEIRRFCRCDEDLNQCVQYLMSLPGVGWIVSSYILGRLGGWRSLVSVKKTAGFFGLGPKENSTGEKVRKGSITAVGDPIGRKMIIQASWIAIRKDFELRNHFDHVYFRNPANIAKQKAIVAVGRKLVCRMHAVLREQRSYYQKVVDLIA